ncbi:MAG: TetR/AcrR family transcriptional regulator [Clostridia bacterium]|nr:TetR/AcrR family transcriptional regulator [Clostridia bacterium]
MEEKVSRRERKKEETKKRIMEVALELFRRQGTEATTVEQITEAADVGKGTFYNYFPTKEAVVSYFLVQEIGHRRDVLRQELRQLPDTKSRLTMLMQAWTRFVRENKEFVRVQMIETFKAYLNYGMAEPDQIALEKFLAEILAWGQQQGDIRKDIPAEHLGQYLELMIFGPGSWYCAITEDFLFEEAVADAVKLFLEGATNE